MMLQGVADTAGTIEAQSPVDDPVVNFITMTEEEFRDLLRSVADEVRRERESKGQR